jgi:hypothetical protein
MGDKAGQAPLHAVVKVMEVRGPRGGTVHVLVLSCGSFVTRRLKEIHAAPESVPCIACFVREQMTLEPVVHARITDDQLYKGVVATRCGLNIDVEQGWAWGRHDVTCGRCVAAMDAAPKKKRRRG